MYTVKLNGLKYRATHGLYPQEQLIENEFVVDIEVSFEKKLKLKNDLEELTDYSVLKDIVDDFMTKRFSFLEDIIANIVGEIEKLYPASTGSVGIKKLNPFV